MLKPESEWVMSVCPAIVSEEIWNECNQLLEEQEKKRKPIGPRPSYLLSGYVSCTCGKKMYVFHQNAVYTCKTCKNRIAATDLDDIYHDQLKSFLMTDKDVSDYVTQTDRMIKEKEELLAVSDSEAKGLRRKINELVAMRLSGEMPKDAFPTHYTPLQEQLTQLDGKLPELEAELDFLKIQSASSDTVLIEAKNLYDSWQTLSFENKRSIIETITDTITIGKEDITISLSYLPNSIQNAGNSARNFRDSCLPPA